MTPKPVFTFDDYVNPEAPKGQRRIRADHFEVRDLSYDHNRTRQLMDLYKDALIDPGYDPEQITDDESTWPTDRLELYIKRRSRGKGYVADFVYASKDLPVTVYGVFVDRGRGLEIAELELFRPQWGHFDKWGTFVGEVDAGESRPDEGPIITTDLLRQLPLGRIIAKAQQSLADAGILGETVEFGEETLADDGLERPAKAALDAAVIGANRIKRGRPPLSTNLLKSVAYAYIDEAPLGVGLLSRLSRHFDRPASTIRDWVAAARREGYLTTAVRGQRGAGAGPNLPPRPSSTWSATPPSA
jgi:hypothetical protein